VVRAEHPADVSEDRRRLICWLAIAGQIVFAGGWLIGGAIEGDGYSHMKHEISDLGALTANNPLLAQTTLFLSGLATVVFAFLVVRPELGKLPAWLVALSLLGLDGLSDPFFRLDCRRVDPGCTSTEAADSWHGTIHIAVFLVAAAATIAACFVLSRRMRARERWSHLARPTQWFGIFFIVTLVITGATSETDVAGLTQRLAATFTALGLVALALAAQSERLRHDLLGGRPGVRTA
jgi:hypothetical protein